MNIELRARGQEPLQYRQFVIPVGKIVRVGRASKADCVVPWDKAISREQADLLFEDGQLSVWCLEKARNPLIHCGKEQRKIRISVGEIFHIGATEFQLAAAKSDAIDCRPPLKDESDDNWGAAQLEPTVPNPIPQTYVEEYSYSLEELSHVKFGNAAKQLAILSELPQLISDSHSDEELAQKLVELLLSSIPQSEAVAVAHYEIASLPADDSSDGRFPDPAMMRIAVRDRFTGSFRPSRRLITKALQHDETAMQIWSEQDSNAQQFTVSEGLAWAFTVPIPGESCHGWCLYVAGRGGPGGGLVVSEEQFRSDLRFTGLVAQFIGSIRQVRFLQDQKTQLSTFFSPTIIENVICDRSQSLLAPAERDITVLFCDVRGFSRKAEKLRNDLPQLLESMHAALGVMTGSILDCNGTIADFQGDAALGFWGWPVAVEHGPLAACRAALAIWSEFCELAQDRAGPLYNYSVGVGISHGRALAGRIGTDRQAKVGVIGPVVNCGSRLEGMTKQFGVPICVDETTALFVKRSLPRYDVQVRPLACVCPHGMEVPLMVHAIIPADWPGRLSGEMLALHEEAVEAVRAGCWAEASQYLDQLPEVDGPSRFLRSFLSRQKEPPQDWNGVISLQTK